MISIDWSEKIIFIPTADLTEVSAGRYQLDIYTFHQWLRDAEDNDDGMVNPVTHEYNGPLEIGGTVLAKSVNIINGYTVTFEDGSYIVDVVGGNSNLMDVLNFNSVSVRSNVSAGMVEVSTSSNVNVIKVNGEPIDSLADIADEVWRYER